MRLPLHRTIIAVCLLGLAVISGCASSRTGRVLNVAVGAASTADYVTTRQALAEGRGREGNALLGQGALRQAVLKAAGTTGVILLANLVERRHPVAAHLVRGVVITAWSVVAVHNAGVGR